ncbi:hypothetical protein CHUAL_010265 [Chamberlinius hualienensis]
MQSLRNCHWIISCSYRICSVVHNGHEQQMALRVLAKLIVILLTGMLESLPELKMGYKLVEFHPYVY